MKKLFIMILSLLLVTGCSNTDEIVSAPSTSEETTMNSLDNTYYKIYNAGDSEIREKYYSNHNSTKDFENIGRDLQLLSSQYFSTSSYYMSEGQYIGKEERLHLLQRSPEYSLQPKSGTVIEGVEEPIMISNVYEQDYWVKEGNQYILKGVSIAIVIDPTDKNDKSLDNPMSENTIKEYSQGAIEKLYQFINQSDYETMKKIRNLPILICVFQGTDENRSILDGKYIMKCYCDESMGQIVHLNHKNVMFTSTQAQKIDETTYVEFNQIKKSLKNAASEAAGLVGYAKYIDDTIQSMVIEANLNIKTITELQYLTSLLADKIDSEFTYDFEIQVLVYSQNGLKAVILKDRGKSAKSSIFY